VSKEVWAVWPSVNSHLAGITLRKWRAAGYRTAVLIDRGCIWESESAPDKIIYGGKWEGFPHAVNLLCRETGGDVVVCAGDDIYPSEEETPIQIQDKFLERFPDTFGVMQPTGDRFGSIDLCCPCPWVGRKFIDEAYGEGGPYWEGYFHYFSDQEIQDVATLMGAFQQRQEISQFHDHWQRDKGQRPPHMKKALQEWKKDKRTYQQRKASNFPDHERKESE